MAMFDGIRRQLRSVIQWETPGADMLFQQWRGNGDELKNASKLIAGPGQGCIFVYEGKVKAVLNKECLINLETDNIPFWTTVSKFMQFFESEHKAHLYFYRRTKILNQKRGTNSPIKYDDPKYKFPVGLRAYGNYSYRIADPKAFFVNVVGTENDFFIDFQKNTTRIPSLKGMLSVIQMEFIYLRNYMAQTMGSNFAAPRAEEIVEDSMHKLAQLKKMFQAELISEEEYVAKKKQILDTL